jgi:pimeloyl-ACP methyl ester carboxylesterase
MSPAIDMPASLALHRPEGDVAYEVSGRGPLIVCVPGMGDMRSSYRFLEPELVGAGFRVAVMDLRGHGDSDVTFSEYGDRPTAGDIEALVVELGGPAILVGNSMAAGASVIVAAQRPELVSALVLVGPFVRDPSTAKLARLATTIFMGRPWAAGAWNAYLPKLYTGRRPDDFGQYRRSVAAALRRPGYARAFSRTTRTRHDDAERALTAVITPTLVVMGEQDPDFPDPAVEAKWIGHQLQGEVLMVPEAGHYPHSQRPDVVGPAVVRFACHVHGLEDKVAT